MAKFFEEIKKTQQKVRELESDYNKKSSILKEKKEIIRQNKIFNDLEMFCCLEAELGIPSISTDNYDRARNFYNAFSFVWKYLNDANNLIEPTPENIYSFGQYLFSDVNGLFTEEELQSIRRGTESLANDKDNVDNQFYVMTSEHPVYKIATLCLRLESLGFKATYELEKECICELVNIETLKKQIRDYKIEVGETIIKGSAKKAEQTVNTVVLPTIDTVITPNIKKGIKMLTKKIKKDDK